MPPHIKLLPFADDPDSRIGFDHANRFDAVIACEAHRVRERPWIHAGRPRPLTPLALCCMVQRPNRAPRVPQRVVGCA